MSKRIIARLDIKGPNVVKGIHFEGLRVLGKPEDFAKYYYKCGADEIVYQDVVASLYQRNNLEEIIKRTAKEIFIPLIVGGGIRSITDIEKVLRAGADKVALNTAALRDEQIVKDASRKFGSSTIVVAIEAIKEPDGRYLAYTENGRNFTGVDVLEWSKIVEQLGAGEILLSSVDRDGTGLGFDIDLIEMVSETVTIPVIAHGGPGNLAHIVEVLRNGKADGVCLASILHYNLLEKMKNFSGYDNEGNIEYLKSNRINTRIKGAGLEEIKNYILGEGIECRIQYKTEGI